MSDYHLEGEHSFFPPNFVVYPTLDSPQMKISWELPETPLVHYMIRRKQVEFPLDITDGVLVAENTRTPHTQIVEYDIGTDLLPAGVGFGDSAWWYYKMFVRETSQIEEQLGGRAYQQLESAVPAWVFSDPADVQQYAHITVLARNNSTEAVTWVLGSGPEVDGPWTTLNSEAVQPGELGRFVILNSSHKYLRNAVLTLVAAIDVEAWIIVNYETEWKSGPALEAAALAYKPGRHNAIVFENPLLPPFYIAADVTHSQQVTLEEAVLDSGETVSFGRAKTKMGPLQRFLSMFCLELDRLHAYNKAITAFDFDIDSAPPARLMHIAFEMGWRPEINQDLTLVRQQLFNLPGIWKSKGTSKLVRALVEHEMSVVPRVQEGHGLLARAADPRLFVGE